jgi:glucosamine--fructose-6-phosphate aminotransferase (isomerizing)
MYSEACESAEVINRQLQNNIELCNDFAQFLNQKNPYSIVTIARGSSDHAAQFFNFMATAKLGKLTTSLSMSAITLYQSEIDVSHSIGVAISQSGQSPDIIKPIEYFKNKNSPSFALVNDENSPLAISAQFVFPLLAGKEISVAATKSFIASLSASALLLSHWKNDQELIRALHHLPDDLQKALKIDWSHAVSKLINAKRIMVVGRGYGLSLALECALKFKETCGIQAEAFSAAEIKHGPMALVENGYPILIFATRGPALHQLLELAYDLKTKGANVILAAPHFVKERDLEIQSTHSEELDIITCVQSFYLLAEELSRTLGRNPDTPKNLTKTTKTN